MCKLKVGDKVRIKGDNRNIIYEVNSSTSLETSLYNYDIYVIITIHGGQCFYGMYPQEELELAEENPMPELIPGKHIIVDDKGKKYLVLADGILVEFEGIYWSTMKGNGWSTKTDVNIIKVYEININYAQRSDCSVENDFCNKLIWSKEDSNKESIKQEYSELMDKIKDLQKKAEDIKGKL